MESKRPDVLLKHVQVEQAEIEFKLALEHLRASASRYETAGETIKAADIRENTARLEARIIP